MKVLYFHQHFSTPEGSTGTRSYEFSRRLIAHGHAVTVVCGSYTSACTGLTGSFISGQRRGKVDGIDVIEFSFAYSNSLNLIARSLVFLRYAFRSINVAITESYDLVLATSTPLTVGVPALAARWFRRKPFVFEVRDLWPELPKQMGAIANPVTLWILGLLERAACSSAHGCVGLAPGILEGIFKAGGDAGKTVLIPNGSDVELFKPAMSRQAGKRHTGLQVVFAGTHGMANGLDAVLDAVAELIARRSRGDIDVFLIGDGGMKAGLELRARQEGLKNLYFEAPIPKRELAKRFSQVDVGLQVLADVPGFYYGTSPNKFFDYLAAGLPVVTNYPGWVADLITEHRCGLAAPPGDAIALADSLEYLADHPEERMDMGRRARWLAETQFDRDRLAGQMVDFLEAVYEACS